MGFRRGQRSQGRPTGGDIRGNFFGNLSNNQEPGAWDAFLANSMPQISPWAGKYGSEEQPTYNPETGERFLPGEYADYYGLTPYTGAVETPPSDPFYNPGLAPFFPRYPGAELPNQGGRGGSELDWLPQPPRMPWDRVPSPRPPFPPPFRPPFRPPQRPQMPAFGWISPTGVTPEYRSWMPGMSFAAERSYRNPARPFPIPSPIMPPGYTPPVTPPGYTPPGYTPPSLPPGFPIGPIDGIGGGGGGWGPGITKAGGGKIPPLAQGMVTGMAVGGRTGYQQGGRGGSFGEVPDDYTDSISDYYGIGGGGGLAIPPQPGMRSYGALPSPQGYRPGFDAEWNYFPYSNVPVSAYGQTGQTPYTAIY